MVNQTGRIVQPRRFCLICMGIAGWQVCAIIPKISTISLLLGHWLPYKVNVMTLLICNFPYSCHSADTESDHGV